MAQVDNLIEALKQRKQQLISNIQEERDQKLRIFKEQMAHCTQRLQKTTGLLQFSIEVLKESDPTAFLQVKYTCLCTIQNRQYVKKKNFFSSEIYVTQRKARRWTRVTPTLNVTSYEATGCFSLYF